MKRANKALFFHAQNCSSFLGFFHANFNIEIMLIKERKKAMDWSSIIVGAVTGLCALAGTYLAHNKTTALILYRLEQLEIKQDKHNSLIERTYKLENDVKKAHYRIDELKEEVKHD